MALYKEFNINDYKDDVNKLKNINVVGLVYVQGKFINSYLYLDVLELNRSDDIFFLKLFSFTYRKLGTKQKN